MRHECAVRRAVDGNGMIVVARVNPGDEAPVARVDDAERRNETRGWIPRACGLPAASSDEVPIGDLVVRHLVRPADWHGRELVSVRLVENERDDRRARRRRWPGRITA